MRKCFVCDTSGDIDYTDSIKDAMRLLEDIEKAEKVVSNAQLYKQAGNSIVVNVLYHIFKQLF